MSTWAAAQKPFFFLIDVEMQKPVLCPLEEAKDLGFLFDIKGFRNFDPTTRKPKPIPLSIKPVAKETYTHAYQRVIDEIYKGNSFLLNLTFPSAIETRLDLEDVFLWAKAPYKLHHQIYSR